MIKSKAVASIQGTAVERLKETAAPKGNESYEWFTYTGPRLALKSKMGSSLVLENGSIFGVRLSGDKKSIRLVAKDATTKVFTLPMPLAQKIAKTCRPVKSGSKVEMDDVLEEDALDAVTLQYANVLARFQSKLKDVPKYKLLVKASAVLGKLQKEIEKAHSKNDVKALTALCAKAEKVLTAVSAGAPQPKAVDAKLQAYSNKLLKVCQSLVNYWNDEPSIFMSLDIVDYLILAATLRTGSTKLVEKHSRGDTAWRDEIPSDLWDWIQENAR